MSKPFDYYAGYPGQRKTPKWIGIVLGSLFGTMALVVVAIGVRLLVPARVAQASVAKPAAASPETIVALAAVPATDSTVAGAGDETNDEAAQPDTRGHKRHGKRGVKLAQATKAPKIPKLKETKQYKRAQIFAKTVASGSHRDRKARAELDRMLGL